MGKTFDIAFKIFSTLLGLFLIFMGGVWALQGLNLAFNGPMVGGKPSFMVGDPLWIFFGAVVALLGLGQTVWSLRRRR